MLSNIPIGIQSWCFRNFKSNADTIQCLKSCGAASIEICGVHVDFNSPENVAAAVAEYRSAGVRILASGVNTLTGDVTRDRPMFDFLKQANAKYMSVSFPVGIDRDALSRVEAMAGEYDVLLGIHNHGGRDWLGSPEMLGHMLSITGDRVGIWLDTAWALDAGADPVEMVKKFGSRVFGLHVKDFTFDTARRPTDVVIGTGNLDLPKLIAAMDAVGFDGPAIIEYEGDADNPVPALADCVKALRAELG